MTEPTTSDVDYASDLQAAALLDLPPVPLLVLDVPTPEPDDAAGCCTDGAESDSIETPRIQPMMLLAGNSQQVSQNGWPASSDRNAIGVRTFAVPGAPDVLLPIRADVAPLLLEFARWWHTTVEHLVVPGCWGYAYRDIRGGGALSNHASGTAIDLNAPKHPLGAVGTVPGHLRGAIEAKAASLGLRWGGSYTGRKDEMHAEVNVNHARAMQLVAALQGTPPPPPNPGGKPTLKQGAKGEDVKIVQRAVGVQDDGIFGPKTTTAVKAFQAGHGLAADGIVGPLTWGKILAPPPAPPAPPVPTPGRATIRRGYKGQLARDLQARLNRDYPAYSNLAVDGDFGARTEAVVKEFQRRAGLAIDGIVGPKTWAALGF